MNSKVLHVVMSSSLLLTACGAADMSSDPSATGTDDSEARRRRRHDAGVPVPSSDGGSTADGSAPPPAGGMVGPMGGSVDRLKFGVFGDVRPPSQDNTARYPTPIITSVMTGAADLGAQFIVASGDYMFATNASTASAQIDLLLGAESHFGGHVFHALGNHECNGASTSNCPNGDETGNIQVYRQRLAPSYATPYFDWMVHTSAGDAHFIATAPNAWSAAEQTWLDRALAVPALYTFVIAHEPPGQREAPGSPFVEHAIQMRSTPVTLRLYGHTHEYSHPQPNAIITGNAGAPLAHVGYNYGFVVVEQRADSNIVVSEYDIGTPPTVADSFVLTPDGRITN